MLRWSWVPEVGFLHFRFSGCLDTQGLASSHLLPSGGLDYKAKGFVFVQRAVGTVPSDRLSDGPGPRVPELAVPGPPFSDANASEAAGHAGYDMKECLEGGGR